MTHTPEQIAQIARGLNLTKSDFLCRVVDGKPLRLADRLEDRARQSLRRLGLVEYAGKPKRWQATVSGLAVRQYLMEQQP